MSGITHQVGATCPSCGRFVGPLEKCPFCGANIKKRLPLRFLRLACLFLALLGIAVLLYAVRGTPTPTIKIGSIGATMNYGYVRLEGLVTRGPIYDPDAQSLRFYLADETGEIQASSFREVTEALRAQGSIPTVGDKIAVEGTLRIRDDLASLNVASADKVVLTPPTARQASSAEIGADDEFEAVIVRGDVRELREPYTGLQLITLGDASGELDVAVNGDMKALYGEPPGFELGDTLEVQGIVTFFRDTPQLVLRHPRDLNKLAAENTAGARVNIGDLDSARVNQRVQVSGQVTRVSKFSQGLRATLADESGEILLVLWQDVVDGLANAAQLKEGALVTVLGKVSEYRGELEIIPNAAADIEISAAVANPGSTPLAQAQTTPDVPAAAQNEHSTSTPTPAPVVRAIGSIASADKDARVAVTGKITRANSFSQGMRYTLDDGTGDIILLLWSNVLEQVAVREQLAEGAVVRVIGKVDVFNDTLEVIPERGEDVELLAAAIVTPLVVRPINSISTADLDKQVLLHGTIAELADFSAGKYVTLRDESGEIRVTVFQNVLASSEELLAIGANVTVRGNVNVFRGNLEVVAEELVP